MWKDNANRELAIAQLVACGAYLLLEGNKPSRVAGAYAVAINFLETYDAADETSSAFTDQNAC